MLDDSLLDNSVIMNSSWITILDRYDCEGAATIMGESVMVQTLLGPYLFHCMPSSTIEAVVGLFKVVQPWNCFLPSILVMSCDNIIGLDVITTIVDDINTW